MNRTLNAALSLPLPDRVMGVELLSERELTEIEGGGLWAGVALVAGAGLLACVIGVGVGVGLYYLIG